MFFKYIVCCSFLFQEPKFAQHSFHSLLYTDLIPQWQKQLRLGSAESKKVQNHSNLTQCFSNFNVHRNHPMVMWNANFYQYADQQTWGKMRFWFLIWSVGSRTHFEEERYRQLFPPAPTETFPRKGLMWRLLHGLFGNPGNFHVATSLWSLHSESHLRVQSGSCRYHHCAHIEATERRKEWRGKDKAAIQLPLKEDYKQLFQHT